MSDMVKVVVQYGALSNVSYMGTLVFEFDRQEWLSMTERERFDAVWDSWTEWLHEDIGMTWDDELR